MSKIPTLQIPTPAGDLSGGCRPAAPQTASTLAPQQHGGALTGSVLPAVRVEGHVAGEVPASPADKRAAAGRQPHPLRERMVALWLAGYERPWIADHLGVTYFVLTAAINWYLRQRTRAAAPARADQQAINRACLRCGRTFRVAGAARRTTWYCGHDCRDATRRADDGTATEYGLGR